MGEGLLAVVCGRIHQIQIPAYEEVEWKAGADGMVLSDECHFSLNNVNTSAYNVIPVSFVN